MGSPIDKLPSAYEEDKDKESGIYDLQEAWEAPRPGYRLMTVEEVLERSTEVTTFLKKDKEFGKDLALENDLKLGTKRDIQDFCGRYFDYDEFPLFIHDKIRLKNGFIDKTRGLLWKEFTTNFVTDQLTVLSTHIDTDYQLKEEDQVVALLFACFLDQQEEVKELLKNTNYFEIMLKNNENCPNKGSALHLCAAQGLDTCLEIFWEKLTDKQKEIACAAKAGLDEETPLHSALVRGWNDKVVRKLCRRGSINQATKKQKMTALMYAAQYQMQNPGMWKPILECQGLSLEAENQRKSTAFHLVSYNESPEINPPESNEENKAEFLKNILELCGCKVSLQAYDAGGNKELCPNAIEEVAQLYRKNRRHTMDAKNDSNVINRKNDKKSSPLHKSLGLRDISTAPAQSDDESDDDKDHRAPSEKPCQAIPIQFSRLLISAGADIHAIDMQGQNALHRACQLPEDLCTIQILFKCCISSKPGDPSARDKKEWSKYTCTQDFYGQTPLHIAARTGNLAAVKLFLDKKYNASVEDLIQIRDYNDRTALHSLASSPDRFKPKDEIKKKIARIICRASPKNVLPLLIWSVAEGPYKLADRVAEVENYKKLAKFLRSVRERCTENLLGLALSTENHDMAVELINRGAIITKDLRDFAQKEETLLKEYKFLNDNINRQCGQRDPYFDDETLCEEMRNNCLIPLYETRKAQVAQNISKRTSSWDQPNMKQIKAFDELKGSYRGRTTDQPTCEDLLERGDIKNSISALLLNQHMGSPITLGIFGGTGMGKSSMMLQVEHNLLSKASRETLFLASPQTIENLKMDNRFTGLKLQSARSKRYARKLIKELQMVIEKNEEKRNVNDFDEDAIKLQKIKEKETKMSKRRWKWASTIQHHLIKTLKKFKDLVLSTFTSKDLVNEPIEEKINNYISKYNEKNLWILKRLALANDGKEVPALMTVQYNAWQYETNVEAWAGLAVAILKEMESCMTKEQLLYVSVMYAYRKNPRKAVINFVLPVIVYLLLGAIVGWVSYKLLSISHSPFLKSLQYGSIPIAIIVTIWKVLVEVSNYTKPISETFMDATKSLKEEHISKIGYQHQVIEDINFLRDQMCEVISMKLLWRIGAIVLKISSGSTFLATGMEASDALKHQPPKNNFRITIFIDNLDRQKGKLYTPLNMILKACDINAVIAIDKESVDDFIEKHENEPKDDTEKQSLSKQLQKGALLQQLIQIPIVLPPPDVSEIVDSFLSNHLKDKSKKKKDKAVNDGKSIETPSIIFEGESESESDETMGGQNLPIINSSSGSQTQVGAQPCENQMPCYFVVIDQSTYSEQKESQSSQAQKSLQTEVGVQPCQNQVPYDFVEKDQSTYLERKESQSSDAQEGLQTEVGVQPCQNQVPYDFVEKDQSTYLEQKESESSDAQEGWLKASVNVLESNYNRGEIDLFKYLATHTYDYYRSPRAWKALLNYHRLIRSLMSYNYQGAQIKAWKRQLILWVFLCWQWKEQMNDIFQDWENLSKCCADDIDSLLVDLNDRYKLKKVLKSESQLSLLKKKGYEHLWGPIDNIYPSLSEIVMKHPKSVSSQQNKEEEKNKKLEDDLLKWSRLSKVLVVGHYDVTMNAIQVFQKYRYDCDTGPLKLVFEDK